MGSNKQIETKQEILGDIMDTTSRIKNIAKKRGKHFKLSGKDGTKHLKEKEFPITAKIINDLNNIWESKSYLPDFLKMNDIYYEKLMEERSRANTYDLRGLSFLISAIMKYRDNLYDSMDNIEDGDVPFIVARKKPEYLKSGVNNDEK